MPTYQAPLRGVSKSEAYAEAMATASIEDAILYMLEVTHEDLAAPIRLVLNSSNVTATLEADAPFNAGAAVEFTAINLGIHFPEETDSNASPPTRIWIDGVSPLVAAELEPAAESLQPVTVIVRTYLSSDLSGPASLPPLVLEMRDIEINETRVLVTLAYADFGNTRFPGKTFTADEHPGLSAR